jgi:glyoxylase-like metal-dependent hydrolase (beta-lactamase superfamily II)/rhodanese-related sulfurtransferase
MVADESTKEAAVIDPQRDIEIYLDEARQHGFSIKYVLLTHFHADFISGHIELRDKAGAEIVMGARAEAEFPFRKLQDGDAIDMGKVRLVGLETPGHTPEGLTILAYDTSRSSAEPYAAFTGDTLFIGDVGRPDLLASIGMTADELAEMLYDSLHTKLMRLPDATLVYPAHGAGSMCGKSLSNEAVSTIGDQKKYNYALQPMSKEDFMSLITADQPEAPSYFAHDAILNRKERASLDESLADATGFGLDEVLRLQDEGAQIVDTRSSADFAGAHLKGSINIGIDGKYATWAGTVLKKDVPIVIIADGDRIEESIMRLGRIGFDHVAGYLNGGVGAIGDRSELIDHVRRITAAAVPELDPPPVIIDVRSPKEWEGGHLEGSMNIPLNQLERRANEVPQEGQVVVHCQSGYRSSIAVSILRRLDHNNVLDQVGGYKAWVQSGLPTTANGTVDACQGGSCSA